MRTNLNSPLLDLTTLLLYSFSYLFSTGGLLKFVLKKFSEEATIWVCGTTDTRHSLSSSLFLKFPMNLLMNPGDVTWIEKNLLDKF